MIFVPYSLKGQKFWSDIYGRQNKVELHRPILDIIDRAKMTPTFNAT